jgi:hypothetical protein
LHWITRRLFALTGKTFERCNTWRCSNTELNIPNI